MAGFSGTVATARAMRPVEGLETERWELTFPQEPLRMTMQGGQPMNTKVRSILGELNRRLATLYGERLRGVYLFGSYARDEANEDSDADVLIVLDRVDNYSREIDTTSELTSELSLEYGISLSRVFATEEQWRKGQTNFFLNLREEAVPA